MKLIFIIFLLFSLVFISSDVWADEVILINWTDKNTIAEECCGYFSVSNDGNYVYFASHSNNITSDDQNNSEDVFLRDLKAKKTIQVSKSLTDKPNYDSIILNSHELISADGRYVGFTTKGQLIPEDTNSEYEAYIYDRLTTKLKRLSENKSNDQYIQSIMGITPDGKYAMVGFKHTNGYFGVYDLVSEKIVAEINSGGFGGIDISGNSRYVVFSSGTIDNVLGKDEIYRYDIQTKNLELISTLEGYGKRMSYSPKISYDGRYIAFISKVVEYDRFGSYKGEITEMFLYDTNTKKTEMLDVKTVDGGERPLFISDDGRYIAFSASDSKRVICCQYYNTGIFILDRETKNDQLIIEGTNADFSSNGQYLAVGTVKPINSEDKNKNLDLYLIEKPFEEFFKKLKEPRDVNLYKETNLYGTFVIDTDCTGAMQINGKNEFSEVGTETSVSVFYPDERKLSSFQTSLDEDLQFVNKIHLSNEMPEGNYKIQMTQQGAVYENIFYYNGRTQTPDGFLSCKGDQELTSIKKNITDFVTSSDSEQYQKSLEKYLSIMLTEKEYEQYYPFVVLGKESQFSTKMISDNLNELRTILNEKIKSNVENAYYLGEKQINQNYDIDDSVEIVLKIRKQKDSIINQEQTKINKLINDKINFFTNIDRQEQRQQEIEQKRLDTEQAIIDEKDKLKKELIEKYGTEEVNKWNYEKTYIVGFPDPTKSPDYYLKRYNNEVKYKEWFDSNFPDRTIQSILGVEESTVISEPTVDPEPKENSKPTIIHEPVTEPKRLEPKCDVGSELVNDKCIAIKQPKNEGNFFDSLLRMFANLFR